MHNTKPPVSKFPMNPTTIEIAFLGAMTVEISKLGWVSRFEYEPGHELSVELSASGHIVSGDTPEGPLTFDLVRGLDIQSAWARFERELLALHIKYDRIDYDLFE